MDVLNSSPHIPETRIPNLTAINTINTNLEFSQWVNVLYDQRMATALIGRLTHHVELILFPGVNNRLRESSINETLSKINSQNG